MRDGIVVRYADDGSLVWAKSLGGGGNEFLGVAKAGPMVGEISFRAGGSVGATFEGVPLEGGSIVLSTDGRLLRFGGFGRFDWSAFGNGFVIVDGATGNLVRLGEKEEVLWSKPPLLPGKAYAAATVCDSTGSVVALFPYGDEEITVAGTTIKPAGLYNVLLVKISLEGEFVWATRFTTFHKELSPPVCDRLGDVYVMAAFPTIFEFGSRVAPHRSGLAIAKVRGATPQVPWVTSIGGSAPPDALGPLAFDATGKLLFAPRLGGGVTVGEDILPAGHNLIRLDEATGVPLSGINVAREITALEPHPVAGAYFAGPEGFGRLILPP